MTSPTTMAGSSRPLVRALLGHAGSRVVALPLGIVVETMRPQPLEPLPGAPPFVVGVSLVRGVPTPVVDVAMLLGEPGATPGRLVTAAVGDRPIALAFTDVIGVGDLGAAPHRPLPPLLGEAAPHVVDALAALGGELVVLLAAAHVVPEAVWRQLAARPT